MNTRTKWTDRLLLILAVFTVTFFVYRDFGIRMIFGFGTLCLILLIHGLRRLRRDDPPAPDPLRLSFLILTLTVFVNFLRPDSRHDADSTSFVIAMGICCAFVMLARPDKAEGKRTLAVCFGGALFIACFIQFFQAFPDLFWNRFLTLLSPTAVEYLYYYVPKGYSITLGGCTFSNYILYIGLAVCCGFAFCGRKFDRKSAAALAFGGLFLATILIVGRRGELLGAVICLVALVLALCGKKLRRILIFGGIAAAAVGFAVIVALLPWLRQFQPLIRYVMTFEQLLSGQDITSGRMELYTLAWNAFLDHPVFGIGWDQFHTLIPAQFLALHGRDVEDVHCIYLQFLTETGLFSAPFLITPLLYSYYQVCAQFVRLKQRPGELRTARMLCITSFMIQSFLLVLGIYDPNFQRVVFWCFHSIATLMLITALDLEGFRPDDPVSRLLDRIIRAGTPLCRRLWDRLAGVFRGRKESALALTLAVFTVTFFFYRDFGSRMIYGYAVLGLILGVHLLGRIRRSSPLVLTPVTLAAAALALVIGIHFLRPDGRRDVDTFSYIISMVICLSYMMVAPADRRDLHRAENAMHTGALAMAAFVVIFTLLPGLFLETVYPLLSETARRYYDFFQPLGYGVSLGTYSYTDYVLFLGVAVCCADLAVKPRTPGRIAAALAAIGAILLAMIVLGRRGELLAALVAVAVLVLALCSRKKRRIILLIGSILTAAAVILVIMFLPQLGKIPVLARYVETVEQLLSGADITSGRGPLLAVALAGFRSHPIFGVGWGQYVRLSAQVGMCDTDGNLIEDCHNIYLQFLCETGIVGAVLILIPILYLLVTTCRLLRHAKKLEDQEPLRMVCVSFLIQFFLLFLGLYDPSFQKIVFWCFYALALLELNGALRRSGWRPAGPMSRGFDRTANILAKLRFFVKEGK